MELPPWIAILLGLLVVLAGTGEAVHDLNDPKYYTEGGNLLSNPSLVFKRTVAARKAAPESVPSLENATQEPKDIKQVELPPVKIPELNSSEVASGEHAPKTPALKTDNTQKDSIITSESPAHTVASNTTRTSTSSDKPVDSSTINSTQTPLAGKKSKPAITFDIDDMPRDENGKAIVSKENLVGAGPSFDYVVPIVIALLAVPFVAVLGAYAYKKSRDFWDRRHYRRMDFLIDGMYND